MDNRVARIGALRRYISLLRQEEARLNGVKESLMASHEEREDAKAALHAVALKIGHADRELRGLERSP
jgi:hypothetical protein